MAKSPCAHRSCTRFHNVTQGQHRIGSQMNWSEGQSGRRTVAIPCAVFPALHNFSPRRIKLLRRERVRIPRLDLQNKGSSRGYQKRVWRVRVNSRAIHLHCPCRLLAWITEVGRDVRSRAKPEPKKLPLLRPMEERAGPSPRRSGFGHAGGERPGLLPTRSSRGEEWRGRKICAAEENFSPL